VPHAGCLRTQLSARAFPRAKLRRISLAIWLAAFALRLVLIFGFHRYEPGRTEAGRIAVSLATHGSFADPYSIPTGPTAHSPPLYPLLMAPIYAFWGDSDTGRSRADLTRIAFSAAAASAEYALLPWVAESLGIAAGTGIAAGIFGALVPLQYWPECMGDFETTWTALWLECSVILFARGLLKRSFPATATGIYCGLGVLLAPNIVPVLAGFLPIAWWRLGSPVYRQAAKAALVLLLVISPWMVRNRVRLGGWFFIRDDFGLTLYLSNNDQAEADEEKNIRTGTFEREHPFRNAAAAERIAARGELPFEREMQRRAMDWIGSHPRRFLELTLRRILNFWFPVLLHPVHRFALWTLNLAAVAGWIGLARSNRTAAAVTGSVLLTFPGIYYFVNNFLRYQHPVYWILLLLAGAAEDACAIPLRHFRHFPAGFFRWSPPASSAGKASAENRFASIADGIHTRSTRSPATADGGRASGPPFLLR
jgi:hypothetical protein